jgi:tetratricopeptide (TPR) repeat protein/predicted Ser/Thr protein kinase
MPCLDDQTVLAFLSGELDEASTEEVEVEIDRCESCRELLATLVKASSRSPQREAGDVVGRYRLEELIGQGAMGEVYRAHDPEVDRSVAIKFIQGHGLTSQESIVREAQAMGRLRHAHVVQVFDVGADDAQAYVVMEYIDGPDLGRWLAEKSRSWQEIADVFEQAASGLSAAHDEGIIHRDFKPANVIVDSKGRAHVADFGLAQVGQGVFALPEGTRVEADLMRATRTGSVVGTPAYMAPELLEGADCSPESDQFALAVALYEALYEHRPFAGDTLEELLATIRANKVTPPKPGAQVPGWLAKTALRGIGPDPKQRWSSIEEFRENLRPRPTRRGWVAGGTAAIALAGGLALFAWPPAAPSCDRGAREMRAVWSADARQSLRESLGEAFPGNTHIAASVLAATDRYAADWSTAADSACRETHIDKLYSRQTLDGRMACLHHKREALRMTLARLGGSVDAARHGMEAIRDLSDLAECTNVAAISELEPLPTGSDEAEEVQAVRVGLAELAASLNAGSFAEGARAAEDWHTRAEATGYKPVIAEALEIKGSLEHAAGMHEEAETSLNAALLAAAAGRHRFREASANLELAELVGYTLGRFEEGKRHAELALAVLDAIGGNDLLSAHVHKSLGIILSELGKNDVALEHYEKALEKLEAIYGPDTIDSARTIENMGMVYLDQGKLEEAEKLYERARTNIRKAVGTMHPAWADSSSNYSHFLLEAGKAKEAIEAAKAGHEVREKLLGEEHPDVAKSNHNLGSLHQRVGDLAGARTYLERAIAAKKKAYGERHKSTAMTLHALGLVHQRLKEPAAAVPLLKEAESIFIETLGPEHAYVAVARSALGEAYLGLDDFPSALTAFEYVVSTRAESDYGKASVLAERFNLALSLWHGKSDRVRALEIVRDCLRLAKETGNAGYEKYFTDWLATNAPGKKS